MNYTNYFNNPSDSSDQFAFDARDLYQQQTNMNQPSGFYFPNPNMNPSQQNYYNGYNVPNNLQNNLVYMQQQGQPYYQQQFQLQGFGMPQPQPNGYVGNPAMQYINNMQQQGYNYNPTRFGYGYNNRYGYSNNPFYQQQIQYQDRNVHVPGYNPSGEYLFTSDFQDKLDQMQVDMMYDQEAAIAKREKRSQGYFNANQLGYNYYGMPYYNNYYDQGVVYKYQQKIEEIKEEAAQRRLDFNKNLSHLVHNWLGDDLGDQDIDRIYEGYSYTIPGATLKNYADQDRLARMVPVDTAAYYREQDKQVSDLYHMIMPQGRNMNEFFEDCGFLRSVYNLDEEKHRRRDNKTLYDTDVFHTCMRKYALKNDIDDRGVDYNTQSKKEIMYKIFGKEQVDDMERRGVSMDASGAINVSAPEEMKRRLDPQYGQYQQDTVLTNELENDYNYQRNRFIESIMKSDKKGPG